jgi:hypothetical protein
MTQKGLALCLEAGVAVMPPLQNKQYLLNVNIKGIYTARHRVGFWFVNKFS